MNISTTETAQKIVKWIGETVSAAGAEGVVFGLSGGIDSSVVAVLSKRAFPDSSLGINMPCHSDELDRKHAELVASKFDIPVKIVVLDEVFNTLINIVSGDDCLTATKRLAEANIKPRLRMVTLYYYANRLNYLVVGASNRSELSIGYFTKYGDGGADLLPLSNLLKRQVCDLAAYLDIPREIIDKAPSAGLWRGQTDETELGFTYNELDRYLTTGQIGKGNKEKMRLLI